MVTKTKYPGICNACGRKCEYQIRCGIHTIMLCGSCLKKLKDEIKVEETEQKEYNNSEEVGLIPPTGGVV